MYALKVLHKKLKQACPFIHQKRLAISRFCHPSITCWPAIIIDAARPSTPFNDPGKT